MTLLVGEEKKMKTRELTHGGRIEPRFETRVPSPEMNNRRDTDGDVRTPVSLKGRVSLVEGSHGGVVIGQRGA